MDFRTVPIIIISTSLLDQYPGMAPNLNVTDFLDVLICILIYIYIPCWLQGNTVALRCFWMDWSSAHRAAASMKSLLCVCRRKG